MEESLGFVTEYMADYTPTTTHTWDSNHVPLLTYEIVEGKDKTRMLSNQLRQWLYELSLAIQKN
jgi:hypothetical protein